MTPPCVNRALICKATESHPSAQQDRKGPSSPSPFRSRAHLDVRTGSPHPHPSTSAAGRLHQPHRGGERPESHPNVPEGCASRPSSDRSSRLRRRPHAWRAGAAGLRRDCGGRRCARELSLGVQLQGQRAMPPNPGGRSADV